MAFVQIFSTNPDFSRAIGDGRGQGLASLSTRSVAEFDHRGAPLRELLAYVCLLFILGAMNDDEGHFPTDGEDGSAEKFMATLLALDAPYFLRYLFKLRHLKSSESLEKCRARLEKSWRYGSLVFTHGNTQTARLDKVRELLFGSTNHILDIGCGDGFYATSLAPRLAEGRRYTGIDKDAFAREETSRAATAAGLANVSVAASPADVSNEARAAAARGEMTDVLLVEVIEHMDIDEARSLVAEALAMPSVASLIITTPNARFNRHYSGSDRGGMRHEDHRFELDQREFEAFVRGAVGDGADVLFLAIGDAVDGEPSTLGARVVTRLGAAAGLDGAAGCRRCR